MRSLLLLSNNIVTTKLWS